MKVLGIETSCDETAAAVVEGASPGRSALAGFRVLSSVVSSQVRLHAAYAGVVPELASRAHMESVCGVIERALSEAFGARGGMHRLASSVEAVAFTRGPGLLGALLVGKVAAHTLARAHGLPLVGVNHLEAHALAVGLAHRLPFPFLALIVSGGHTELLWLKAPGRYRVLGRTRDDAAGEVLDKAAKLMGLGYPGGPAIDALARKGDARAVRFPRPMLPGSWDFSFSGLKTALLYYLQGKNAAHTVRCASSRSRPTGASIRNARRLSSPCITPLATGRPPGGGTAAKADVASSFQEAVMETLALKTLAAAKALGASRIVVGGGVAANSRLRSLLSSSGKVQVCFPPLSLCTDNAAMIAYAAALRLEGGSGKRPRQEGSCLVDPSLPIRSWR
ncbi:MAG: tRNA (adenosine(37)-N6)-threonylcarbamoyltransferase complex transferase subunit TsaD [Elusimicrobiota bacterium]